MSLGFGEMPFSVFSSVDLVVVCDKLAPISFEFGGYESKVADGLAINISINSDNTAIVGYVEVVNSAGQGLLVEDFDSILLFVAGLDPKNVGLVSLEFATNGLDWCRDFYDLNLRVCS